MNRTSQTNSDGRANLPKNNTKSQTNCRILLTRKLPVVERGHEQQTISQPLDGFDGEPVIYLCLSRVVDRRFVFVDENDHGTDPLPKNVLN